MQYKFSQHKEEMLSNIQDEIRSKEFNLPTYMLQFHISLIFPIILSHQEAMPHDHHVSKVYLTLIVAIHQVNASR
jgi:hypothetical protein